MNAQQIREWSSECAPDCATNDGLLVARAVLEVAAQLAELNEKLDILTSSINPSTGAVNVNNHY